MEQLVSAEKKKKVSIINKVESLILSSSSGNLLCDKLF